MGSTSPFQINLLAEPPEHRIREVGVGPRRGKTDALLERLGRPLAVALRESSHAEDDVVLRVPRAQADGLLVFRDGPVRVPPQLQSATEVVVCDSAARTHRHGGPKPLLSIF